MSENEKSVL